MKIRTFLLTLTCLFSSFSLTAETWVQLARVNTNSVSDVTFLDDIFTSTYEDYMIVVDMLEPLGGYSDVVIQLSTDNGDTWISSYSGGITYFNDSIYNTNSLADIGIALTSVADPSQGQFYFTGKLHLSNVTGGTNLGLPAIHGTGTLNSGNFGSQTFGCVYGYANGHSTINALRFICADMETVLNRASVTVYGLSEF